VTEPRLVEPVISWGGKNSEQAPGEPFFFGGSPVTVCARLEDAGKATAGKKVEKLAIKAKLDGKSRKWDVGIVDVKSPDLPIPALWARERIRDLEGSGGEAAERGSRQTERKARMIREMIVSLSRDYGVLSGLTSYIAIEKRKEKDKATGEIVLRKIPVLVSMGWHGMGSVTGGPTVLYHHLSDVEMQAPGRRGDVSWPSMIGTVEIRQNLKSTRIKRSGMRWTISEQGRIATAVLTRVFSLQDADGSFALTAQVAGMLGIKVGDLKAAAKKIEAGAEVDGFRLLSTAVILKVLEVHFPAQMANYRGLIKKSKQWLRDSIDAAAPRIGRQDLMDWVEAYIEKSVRINTP
ncbi:hypothetical protein ACFL2Z_01230, partial [Candidatus Eisenbacteria bacterium]